MTNPEAKGKKRVLLIIGGVLIINALVIALTHVYGVAKPYSEIAGFALAGVLCIFLYLRHKWAKWSLIVLLSINTLIVVVGWVAYATRGMGIIGLVYAPIVLGWIVVIRLLISKEVTGYLAGPVSDQ